MVLECQVKNENIYEKFYFELSFRGTEDSVRVSHPTATGSNLSTIKHFQIIFDRSVLKTKNSTDNEPKISASYLPASDLIFEARHFY